MVPIAPPKSEYVDEKTKWLTYLVYLILTFQTITMGWLVVKFTEMPDRYVRLERYVEDKKTTMDRYNFDITRIEKMFDAIMKRLDTIK